MTTILVGFAFGTGSDWPLTTALVAPAGSGYSHELIGNSAGLAGGVFTERRARLVVAEARRFICTGVPPLTVMVGHGFAPPSAAVASVTARAMATLPVRPFDPLGPLSSTQAAATWLLGAGSQTTVVVTVVRFGEHVPASIEPSSTTRVIVVVPGVVHMNCIGSDGPTPSSCPCAPTPPDVAPNAPIGLLIVHV